MITDSNIKQTLSLLNQERIKKNARRALKLNQFKLLKAIAAVKELEALGIEMETALQSKLLIKLYFNKNKHIS